MLFKVCFDITNNSMYFPVKISLVFFIGNSMIVSLLFLLKLGPSTLLLMIVAYRSLIWRGLQLRLQENLIYNQRLYPVSQNSPTFIYKWWKTTFQAFFHRYKQISEKYNLAIYNVYISTSRQFFYIGSYDLIPLTRTFFRFTNYKIIQDGNI